MNLLSPYKEAAWKRYKAAGKAMNGFPKGPLGLTPDHVKSTPEWQAARQEYQAAFAALRKINSLKGA